MVHALRGAAGGLTATNEQYFSQSTWGLSDAAEAGDGFGAALAVGDFDGAAAQDVAVGVPGEDLAEIEAGLVQVLYSDASGLVVAGQQDWSQDSAGIADVVEKGDRFGSVLAAGTLSSDAIAELVVGVPAEDIGEVIDAGAVHVIRGAAGGLTATNQQFWSQDTTGIGDAAEFGDGFGAALATGDMDGTPGQDLAVGAGTEDAGMSPTPGSCTSSAAARAA